MQCARALPLAWLSLALSALSRVAGAQDETNHPPNAEPPKLSELATCVPPAPQPSEGVATPFTSHWAVELNPLALALLRASATVEVALGAHGALELSPIFQADTGDIGTGFWGELGYRYYAGDGGLQGMFLGTSLIAGTFSYATDQRSANQQGSSVGVAIDGGYQYVFQSGMVLGFGIGIQYQQVARTFDVRNDPVNEFTVTSGLLPRLLLSLGYAR